MVHKEFAADLPESDGADTTGPPGQMPSQPDPADSNVDIAAEVNNVSLAGTVNATTPTSHNQSTPDSAEDTALTIPEASRFPNRMSLCERKELNYYEPSTGRGTFTKQARLATSVSPPKIPPQCCPAKIPSTLLLALDNPSRFESEVVEQSLPFLAKLCHRHLLLFASAIALKLTSTKNQGQQHPLAQTASDAPPHCRQIRPLY